MNSPHHPPAETPTPQDPESLEGFQGWCFGACELRPHQRQLKVNGSVRLLPAKSFELLLLLVRERHRVVSHSELVDRLWAQGDASGRLLPAAIARLRAAIDIDIREWGHETSAIRTVHRTGYRFVAPLRVIEPEAPLLLVPPTPTGPIENTGLSESFAIIKGTAAAQFTLPGLLATGTTMASHVPAQRLGLMRCLNLTNKPALAGTEVGMVTLAGHALARDPRLSISDIDTSAKWPEADHHLSEAAAARLMENLGLQALLQCTLQTAGETLVLEHRLVTPGQAPIHGSSSAVCPHVLALQLAQWVQNQLFGAEAVVMRLESDDDFVNLAIVKAMAFFDHGDFQGAADLFNMVRNMQSSSLAADLWRVRAWTRAADPRGAPAALEFLAKARASGDEHTLAMALTALQEPIYI